MPVCLHPGGADCRAGAGGQRRHLRDPGASRPPAALGPSAGTRRRAGVLGGAQRLPPDPKTNHLAVHTEDHPLEYLDFSGEIPAGEYGGGSMTIWDTGTYEIEKWNRREVIVRIYSQHERLAADVVRELDGDAGLFVRARDQVKVGEDPAGPVDQEICWAVGHAIRLRDVASLFQAIGDAGKASYYNAAADSMYNGILGMWMNGKWAVYKDYYGGLAAPNMSVWYADASAQLFPVLYEVIPGSDSRAQQAYAAFNAAWPGWTNLSFSSQDEFPWVMIADAAALMGDTARANAYINTIQQKYVSKGFPWTWYNMEAGWFMRLNAYMMGQRPF